MPVLTLSDGARGANSVGGIAIEPRSYRFEFGEDDQAELALGGIGGFGFAWLLGLKRNGWAPHRDGSRQLGSARGRHLPRQERAQVRRALAAIFRTGL